MLAGIYNTTELVMMQDTSPDFEDTWRFLENRINDAMNMGHTAKQVVGDWPFENLSTSSCLASLSLTILHPCVIVLSKAPPSVHWAILTPLGGS